jgi:hypothetical protein
MLWCGGLEMFQKNLSKGNSIIFSAEILDDLIKGDRLMLLWKRWDHWQCFGIFSDWRLAGGLVDV